MLGAVVSMRALRTNVRDVMQDGSARGGSRRDGRLARALVVTQVTTVTILMFVGRAVRRGRAARAVARPGLRSGPLLQVDLAPSAERFATVDARDAVFRDVQARLAEDGALSGVLLRKRLAARDSGGDVRGAHVGPERGVGARARPGHARRDVHARDRSRAGPRPRTSATIGAQAPVAVISRALAARQWPGRSPLGEQLRLAGRGDAEPWRTIVGVVSDVPYGNPFGRDRSAEAIYVPLLQAGVADTDVIVRYRTSEVAGRQALHQVFGAIDPQMVPGFVFRASEVIEKSGLITVGLAKLFGACFAFALLLAAGRDLRPDVGVDRPAHARDRRAARARRVRRDGHADAADAGRAAARGRHADRRARPAGDRRGRHAGCSPSAGR